MKSKPKMGKVSPRKQMDMAGSGKAKKRKFQTGGGVPIMSQGMTDKELLGSVERAAAKAPYDTETAARLKDTYGITIATPRQLLPHQYNPVAGKAWVEAGSPAEANSPEFWTTGGGMSSLQSMAGTTDALAAKARNTAHSLTVEQLSGKAPMPAMTKDQAAYAAVAPHRVSLETMSAPNRAQQNAMKMKEQMAQPSMTAQQKFDSGTATNPNLAVDQLSGKAPMPAMNRAQIAASQFTGRNRVPLESMSAPNRAQQNATRPWGRSAQPPMTAQQKFGSGTATNPNLANYMNMRSSYAAPRPTNPGAPAMAKGGKVAKYAKGGHVRGDGCARKGHTKGRMI
jgi:hypothetical protein